MILYYLFVFYIFFSSFFHLPDNCIDDRILSTIIDLFQLKCVLMELSYEYRFILADFFFVSLHSGLLFNYFLLFVQGIGIVSQGKRNFTLKHRLQKLLLLFAHIHIHSDLLSSICGEHKQRIHLITFASAQSNWNYLSTYYWVNFLFLYFVYMNNESEWIK
jgi:hypothetical protein